MKPERWKHSRKLCETPRWREHRASKHRPPGGGALLSAQTRASVPPSDGRERAAQVLLADGGAEAREHAELRQQGLLRRGWIYLGDSGADNPR